MNWNEKFCHSNRDAPYLLRADGKVVEVLYGDELYRRILRLIGSLSPDEGVSAADAPSGRA